MEMDIGMLWFDNDKQAEVSAKIQRAADYYHKKYGVTPNLCFVHPSMIHNGSLKAQDEKMRSGEVEVRTSRSVLPNHFWIGVNGSVS
jgi:hypothetical protein